MSSTNLSMMMMRWCSVPTSKYYPAHINLPRMLLSTDNLYEKRIGQVTSDLLYMRFTYYNTDNQQECSRLSNWFSLWCLGTWMKVWYDEEGFVFWFFAFIHVLYIVQVFPIIFPLILMYSQIAFYTKYIVLTFSIDVVSLISNPRAILYPCIYIHNRLHGKHRKANPEMSGYKVTTGYDCAITSDTYAQKIWQPWEDWYFLFVDDNEDDDDDDDGNGDDIMMTISDTPFQQNMIKYWSISLDHLSYVFKACENFCIMVIMGWSNLF